MIIRTKQSARLVLLILYIMLIAVGCRGQENTDQHGSVSLQQESDKVIAEKTDLPQTDKSIVIEETTEQIPEFFIQMLENQPLYREGVLSPDKRYYAYEERSSLILLQLPTAEEYLADKTLLPKVLFIHGIQVKRTFEDLEVDYAQRLRQPLLTEEELNEARRQLRSVYNWDSFFYLKFSQDGRYLAYLGESNFGSDRTCSVYVVDLQDDYELYSLPVEENSEYADITWQEDNQTLELYLPWAETVEGSFLSLRRNWHIPSDQSNLTYYTKEGQEDEQAIDLADAQKAIEEYARAEEERNRATEELIQLTVEQRVAALTAEELEEEYNKYFSLADGQMRSLQERGYSNEAIANMDKLDFKEEKEKWLLSEKNIGYIKNLYPQLKEEDLSHWTYKDFNKYDRVQREAKSGPPEILKQEMLERGLPNDISWRVMKEFHSWDNMLAYTDEAIIAMYEAVQQTDARFRKEEDYRLAVRNAYRESKKLLSE